MGYSSAVEIPVDVAEPGYTMTAGYSAGEYMVTSAVADPTHQYATASNITDSTDGGGAAMLTYASHYAAAGPMMTTVPYCTPLVTDPSYIVQHGGAVTYPHQVINPYLINP